MNFPWPPKTDKQSSGRSKAAEPPAAPTEKLQQILGELEQSARRLEGQSQITEAILESLADGVVVCDRDGRFLVFNHAARDIVGMGITEGDYRQWPERYGCYKPDQITLFSYEELPVIRAAKGEKIDGCEMFIKNSARPEGVWLSINARPLTGREGEVLGGAVVFRDMTAQKKSEQALQQQNLEIAREKAEREQLELFAYAASHDLQEPLQKIIAFSDLFQKHTEGSLDDKGRHFLSRIRAAGSRMSRLIEDLLLFSKAALSREPVEPVALKSLAEEALQDLEIKIAESGACVEIGPLPTLPVCRSQVRQLFQNLISNALKFRSPGRSVKIRIFTAAEDEEKVRIAVEDNGIGFDEKFSAKVFELFERLHSREEYEGSGLGLAVCRKIMTRHGGAISAESRPGQGTVFFLEFSKRFSRIQ